jgi:hypothetical protein
MECSVEVVEFTRGRSGCGLGACLLAGALMGYLLLHMGSLAAAAGALYGESFSEVDIWN